MSTASSQTEKEWAMRAASQNGDVLHVQRLLVEKTNPNCVDSARKIESTKDSVYKLITYSMINKFLRCPCFIILNYKVIIETK